MKKVIFQQKEEPTIDFNEISDNSIIGFVEKYPNGCLTKFGVFFIDRGFYFSSTNENDSSLYFDSIRELIEYVKNYTHTHSNYTVEFFEFDSSKELFKWLGE